MTQNQILVLKKYLSDLVKGCREFKEEKQDLFDRLQEAREENWGDGSTEQDIEEELNETMQEIDQKVKELQMIENSNFKVDTAILDKYAVVFSLLDKCLSTPEKVY